MQRRGSQPFSARGPGVQVDPGWEPLVQCDIATAKYIMYVCVCVELLFRGPTERVWTQTLATKPPWQQSPPRGNAKYTKNLFHSLAPGSRC